ncbi:hypothetical protein [Actinomycetospora atypica]|uniref:Uncharacterized protein n=1 Tax=Actinomycetospora atypica TaxID=1290095 RepID=A0ABV9YRD8_9PSEU
MTRAVPQPEDYDDDGGAFLGVSYRDDGDVPKLVIVGIAWTAGGVVALIAAVLAQNLALAVFGGLSTIAGGALWIALRARDQLQDGEYVPYADPSAGFVDGDYDDEDAFEEEHPTRVMSAGDGGDERGDPDDIEDAEYTEYTDYIERTPSEQDDGTGYDDDRVAQERWEQSQRDREAAAAAAERSDPDEPADEPTDRPTDEPADRPTDEPADDAPTGAMTPGDPDDTASGDSDDDRRGSRA